MLCLFAVAQNCEALLGSHCSSLTMEGSLLAPLMNSSRESLPEGEEQTEDTSNKEKDNIYPQWCHNDHGAHYAPTHRVGYPCIYWLGPRLDAGSVCVCVSL